VALDHVGWDEIDRKRAAVGWAPVAEMGLVRHPTPVKVASEFADLAAADPLAAAALRAAAQNIRDGRASEVFDLRTPQHVSLAGDLGLGVFDPKRIDLRSHDLV
jgi:hypothetical protein